MALFDRFRRKNKSVLPDEVNQYYQSQKRERVGVAIVLGIVALLATLVVAALLFLGGRWAYQQFSGDDSPTEAPEGQVDELPDPQEGQGQVGENGEDSELPGSDQNGDQEVSPPAGDNDNSGEGGDPDSETPQASPDKPTPPLGDQPLPRTGDEGR